MGDHIYTYIYICIYICVCISYTLTQSLSRSLAHIRRQLPSFISTHCHYRAHSVIRLLSLMSTHHGRTIVDIYTTRRTTAHFTSSRRLIFFCFFRCCRLLACRLFMVALSNPLHGNRRRVLDASTDFRHRTITSADSGRLPHVSSATERCDPPLACHPFDRLIAVPSMHTHNHE